MVALWYLHIKGPKGSLFLSYAPPSLYVCDRQSATMEPKDRKGQCKHSLSSPGTSVSSIMNADANMKFLFYSVFLPWCILNTVLVDVSQLRLRAALRLSFSSLMHIICWHIVLEKRNGLCKCKELYNKVEGVNIMGTIILEEEKKNPGSLQFGVIWHLPVYSGKEGLNETIRGNQFTT